MRRQIFSVMRKCHRLVTLGVIALKVQISPPALGGLTQSSETAQTAQYSNSIPYHQLAFCIPHNPSILFPGMGPLTYDLQSPARSSSPNTPSILL